jgi:hypothetical protein
MGNNLFINVQSKIFEFQPSKESDQGKKIDITQICSMAYEKRVLGRHFGLFPNMDKIGKICYYYCITYPFIL